MKPRTSSRIATLAFVSFTLAAGESQAQTWANSNITATPTAIYDWFSGGPNTQATWTGGAPVSGSGTTVTFFADTTTALTNTNLTGSTQIANLNNGASAFQLGTLTLNGKGSTTTSFPRNANHFELISGSALNFSGVTGTINLNATLGTAGTLGFQVGSNIQLGTAGSASALTLTGNGNGAFFISGNISELQTGGGSLTKSGSSLVTLTGSNTYTGTTSVTGGTLRLGSRYALSGGIGATGGTSALTINGGTVELAADDFLRNLGTGASQFQITGGVSGFSTKFGIRNVIVNNNANQEIQWGSASFNPTQFTLSAASADGQLTLQNKIDLNGATRTINTAANGGDRFAAIITGVIRNSSGTSAGLTKAGGGTLILRGANTFDGALTITAGSLGINSIANAGNASPLGQTGSAATLVLNGGTLRYTGAAASSNRSFTLNANSSIDASGSGALNLNNTATPAYGAANAARTLTLTGTNLGDNTLAAQLTNNGSGLVAVTKSGLGNWILSNTSNSFTGVVTVSGGTLSINSIDNGGVASALGSSAAAASNLLLAGGTLKYTGAAASSNRSFSINGGAGAATATIDASGTGALNLTSTATPAYGTASQNRTLVLTGSNTGDNKLSALLTNNTSANSGILVKAGQGKWILNGSAVNTYTGGTQVNTGTLELDFANLGTPTNLIDSTSALTLGGGTLSLVGKVGTASAQTFGNPTFSSQAGSGISVAGANGMTLTLGNTWARSAGSTANVTLGTGGVLTSSPGVANTLVVGNGNIAFATVGGADWAKVSGGNVVAFASGDYNGGGADLPGSGSTTTVNYKLTGSLSVTATDTANTLKLNTSGIGQSLSITSGQTLTLNAGGLLFTGANDYSITGGTLRGSGGTQKELVVHHFGLGNLAIGSTIADNGGATALTKTGAGTLTLQAANTHTGSTYAGGGGTLVLKHQNALQSSPLTLNNSNVVFDSSVTGNAFTIGGLSSPYAGPGYDIVLQNNAGSPAPIALTVTGAGSYSGNLSGPGSLIKSGSGNLNLAGYNTYTGGTTINGGQITLSSNSEWSLGRNNDGTTHVTVNTGGILDLNATGLNYTMTLNGGTLQSGNSFVSDVFGTINLQATSTVNISNGPMNVSALISGTGGLTLTGPSALLSLLNANTFSGDTKVTGSLLQIGHPLALQNSVLDTTGSIVGTGAGAAIGIRVATHTFTLGGLKGNKDLASLFTPIFGGSFSTNMFNTTIQTYGVAQGGYAGVTALTLNPGTGVTPSYSGVIADGAPGMSVIKTGLGTQTLSGANTYTGPTSVTQGTLIINGSTSSTSLVTVNNGATLGGTGTVGGNTSIAGIHNPGNSPGIQTFSNNLAYTGGSSVVNWELIGNTVGINPNPNANFDQIIVGGNLDFTDLTTLNLAFNALGSGVIWSNTFWDTAQSWLLYDVAGTTSNFSNLSLNTINWLDSGSNAFNTVRSGNTFTLTQTGNDIYLNYNVVPEPRAALLGGLGMLMLLRRRRNA